MASVSFSGISSGLDTDSIVEAMCATAIGKVTKSEKAESTIEIKQNVWKQINSKIYSFYTGTLSKMRLGTNFSSIKTSSSNSNVATIASNKTLSQGNHILKVDRLAEKATLSTSKVTYKEDPNDPKSALKTATKSTTLGQILGTGNGNTEIKVAGTSADGSSYEDTITLTDSMTIEELETQLKDKLGHCNVNFNESLGTFSIYTKGTGANESISLSVQSVQSGNNDALGLLGFKGSTSVSGQDTLAHYNGMTIESATNDITIEDVAIKLTGVGSTTLQSETNTDGVVDMVKQFVDEYNTLIDEIGTLVDAESTSLAPLSDEDKEDMTEEEIKKHNEKLEAAALRNDSVLKNLRTQLRKIISEAAVTEKYETEELDENGKPIIVTKERTIMNLASIGITTSKNWKENGKLTLDENKFKEALQSNPDTVKALFTDKQSGVATKLYDSLYESFKGTKQKSTGCLYNDKVLTKELKTQQKQTSKLEERLESLKELYYAKFTAMETMLATINSQSSTIASYFSS